MSKQNAMQIMADFFHNEKKKLSSYIKGRFSHLSEMDIEDIVYDVATSIIQRINQGTIIENTHSYVYRSLSNRAIDFINKNSKTLSLQESFNNPESGKKDSLENTIFHEGDSIEKKFELQDEYEKTIYFLSLLEEKYSELWLEIEIEEKNFRQVSEETGTPIGTLLSRKNKVDKFLKEKIKKLR